MFALVLLSIIKDSFDHSYSRNDRRENRFHTEKQKKNAIFVALLTSFIINPFRASHLVNLFISFRISISGVSRG